MNWASLIPPIAFTLALLSQPASGQSFNIGPKGAGIYNDTMIINAPAPITVGRELEMCELPVRQFPAQFFLNYGTSGRSGPIALADGATVGSNKQSAYTLRMADHGQRFTLHPAADTNASYGPFTATNGAPVTLGNTRMTVVRFPPRMTVSLEHPSRIAQSPTIGIAPLTPAVIKDLYGLRVKFASLANRVDIDTADGVLQGVPRVHSRITGNSSSPVIKTSGRDKQNALKGAELSAITFLDALFAQAFRIRAQAITDNLTFHYQMPAGDYVLCAMQRIKDPNAPAGAGSATAVWWTPFHFDGEHPLSLALTAENAITWREVFTFDKK